jgi:hypothetical protein
MTRMRSCELRLCGAKVAIFQPGTHDCGRAKKHGTETIVGDCIKRYRVARILNKARGQ